MKQLIYGILTFVVALWAPHGNTEESSFDIQNAVRVEIEQLRFSGRLSLGDIHIASGEWMAQFYERRGFQPAWTKPEQIQSLLAAIQQSYL